jgi:hypothetical protein
VPTYFEPGLYPDCLIFFRRIYASVLGDWLGLPSKPALGKEFERMPLFRS